jgi:hypothetical protein
MKVHIQSLFIGYVAGAASMALAPVLVPAVKEVARPVAKAFLKHGLIGMERLRSAIARATESMEDLAAEVRSEVESQLVKANQRRTGSLDATSATVISSTAAPSSSRPSSSMVS